VPRSDSCDTPSSVAYASSDHRIVCKKVHPQCVDVAIPNLHPLRTIVWKQMRMDVIGRHELLRGPCVGIVRLPLRYRGSVSTALVLHLQLRHFHLRVPTQSVCDLLSHVPQLTTTARIEQRVIQCTSTSSNIAGTEDLERVAILYTRVFHY
jgi:hypothetical protein